MSYFSIFSAFRNASDHDYTHDYRDESHQSPNSWVYGLSRLLGLLIGIVGGAYLFWQHPMYGYFEREPAVGSLNTSLIVPAIRWLSFVVFTLVAFRLCSGHSFFWLLGDATRAFKRVLPSQRSRFPFSSFFALLFIVLIFFAANLFITWDLKTAREASATIPHLQWNLSILKREESQIQNKVVSTLSKFPSLRPMLPKPNPNKNLVDISVNVQRRPGVWQSFTFRVHDCLNHRIDITQEWLLHKANSQPVIANFDITKTGKVLPRTVKTTSGDILCLKSESEYPWFTSSLLVDLILDQSPRR